MNIFCIAYTISLLLIVFSTIMVIPLVIEIIYTENLNIFFLSGEIKGFLFTIISSFAIGIIIKHSIGNKRFNIPTGIDGYAIVSFSWIILAFFGALPFYISNTASTYTDAFFETMSGFTTTGATIFTNIEALSKGLLFWRSMTQWLGGIGIIIIFIAIFPVIGIGGSNLFKAEIPGGFVIDKIKPRISELARSLCKVYIFFSFLEFLLLLIGGMSAFDAICHTMTTMSTGGFSTRNTSIAHYNSAFIETTIIIFMFLAGANFILLYQVLHGKFQYFYKSSEFKCYIYTYLIISLLVITLNFADFGSSVSFFALIRDSVFQVVTIGSTTGFGTADYDTWSNSVKILIFTLMFIGGCTGSTAGSIKIMRIIILAKMTYREILKILKPRAVILIKTGEHTIENNIQNTIVGFLVLYISITLLSTLILSMTGMDVRSSLTATAASLGNIGPGFGTVGPTLSYGNVTLLGKWILIFCMLLGRLEIYSLLVLFSPSIWQKK